MYLSMYACLCVCPSLSVCVPVCLHGMSTCNAGWSVRTFVRPRVSVRLSRTICLWLSVSAGPYDEIAHVMGLGTDAGFAVAARINYLSVHSPAQQSTPLSYHPSA